MINIVHTPNKSLNKISENTLNILKGAQNQLLTQSPDKTTSPAYTPSLPNSISLRDALASNKYTDIGMGLYKYTSNDDDYGKIWVKKSILNKDTGKTEEWLVVYTNDEDEIVRQAAMEEWRGMGKVASQKTAIDYEAYRNNPQYQKYFNYLMRLNNQSGWGPGKFAEEGQDALEQQFPELDDIEAGQVLNTFLGEMGYFSEMGGERFAANKIKTNMKEMNQFLSKKANLQSYKAFVIQKLENLGKIEEEDELSDFTSGDMLPYIHEVEQFNDAESINNVLYDLFGSWEDVIDYINQYLNSYGDKVSSFQRFAADVKPENIPIAPGIKSKNLSLDESGGAGTGTVTVEFTDVNKAWDFYQNEVAPGGEKEAPKEEEIPQEEAQGQQSAPPPQTPVQQFPQVQPKASSKKANYGEGVTEDQYGQLLQEGDRVRDDEGRRGEVTKVVGDSVYVNWDGVAEQVKAPISAKTLTKWASPTISEFSDGIKGVKVYKYTKQDKSFGRKPWEIVLKEAMNQKVASYEKYSFVNEDGIEIPITLKKGIKIGEMFERPDNHELVRFAGWIEKKSIMDNGEPEDDYNGPKKDDDDCKEGSQKTAATLDISIEAEDDVLDRIVENLIEGVDDALNGDELEGGLADEKGEDEFDEEQLEKGEDVEMEHTDDEDIAEEIAKDHLMEMDDYYDKLEDMEEEGGKKKKESKLKKKSDDFNDIYDNNPGFDTTPPDDEYAELQKKIENDEVTKLYYAPSDSFEWTDGKRWWNDFGQELRAPDEYDPNQEGYTPFGDEGDIYSSKKIAKVVKEDGKWKVKSESDKTLGTHDTKEEAEKQLQAIEINKHKESKLNKKSDHAMTPNFGAWVAHISSKLPDDKFTEYHRILGEYLPEHIEYRDIVRGVDRLSLGQKIDLEHKLYNLLGMKESNIKSLSFGYDLGGDIRDDWRDTDADDWLLNPPEGVPEEREKYEVVFDSASGKWVVIDTERDGEIVFSDENMETAEHYARDKNYPSGESVASRVANMRVEWDDIPYATQQRINNLEREIEDIKTFQTMNKENREKIKELQQKIDRLEAPYTKTAADISDEIPPMSNVSDESQYADINAPQMQQPLPPRPELNQSPGDVLYDSEKTKGEGNKFQVTTDPGEKTVTVKFIEDEQDKILDQAINEGAGNPLQPQPVQQQSLTQNNRPQKEFEETDSQVNF